MTYAFKVGEHQVHAIPAIHTTHKHIVSFSRQEGESMRDAWNYTIGKTPPRYPVPVVLPMTGDDGRKYCLSRWMEDMDRFWSHVCGGRGLSHG